MIVVDEVEATDYQPTSSTAVESSGVKTESFYANIRPKTVAERSIASTSRLRSSSNSNKNATMENSDRATRSSTARARPQPKLKLKLSDKAAAQAPGMSFLGQYDRELDSDDEELAFEEQFILRLPPGEDLDKLRKMVTSREVSNDVWFKFKGVWDGTAWCSQELRPLYHRRRFSTGCVPCWGQHLLCKAR